MSRQLMFVAAPVLLLVSTGLGFCQGRPDVAAQRKAMKELDFWIGEWKGTGWYQAGPDAKHETTITESIQSKLGGLALLAEGLGQAKNVVTHNALGIVSYDEVAKQYRFTHIRAGNKPGESELKLIEGGVQWELPMGRGKIRFTAKIGGDRWHEVGEYSADGKSWLKIMEMTLQRQKPTQKGKKP